VRGRIDEIYRTWKRAGRWQKQIQTERAGDLPHLEESREVAKTDTNRARRSEQVAMLAARGQ